MGPEDPIAETSPKLQLAYLSGLLLLQPPHPLNLPNIPHPHPTLHKQHAPRPPLHPTAPDNSLLSYRQTPTLLRQLHPLHLRYRSRQDCELVLCGYCAD